MRNLELQKRDSVHAGILLKMALSRPEPSGMHDVRDWQLGPCKEVMTVLAASHQMHTSMSDSKRIN